MIVTRPTTKMNGQKSDATILAKETVEVETATATMVETATVITATTTIAIIATIMITTRTTTERIVETLVETTAEITMIITIVETIVPEADATKNTINVLAIAEIYMKRVITSHTTQVTAAVMEIQTVSQPLSPVLH